MPKIVIFEGGRDRNGRTARASDAFCQGAASADAEIEKIFLPELKIERCRQCDQVGWGTCRSSGTCVIEDDLAGLIGKIRGSAGVVFATPVYYGDLSESLKAFLDRLRRTTFNEDGKKTVAAKPAVGICVAGGGGGGAPQCAVHMEKTLNNIGLNVLDMIPARRQNLELKLEVCKLSGRWFAEQIKN